MKTLGVLASGRGSNAMALWQATQAGGILHGVARLTFLVCDVPGAAIVERARAVGLLVHEIPSRATAREAWEAAVEAAVEPPDRWLLAGFRRILSPSFVQRHAGRVINVHPADTRHHRGLHGYAWALRERLQETWVTVHLVDRGLDTGPVLGRAPVDLRGADTLAEVERRGLAVEHELYPRVVHQWLTGEGSGTCAASSR